MRIRALFTSYILLPRQMWHLHYPKCNSTTDSLVGCLGALCVTVGLESSLLPKSTQPDLLNFQTCTPQPPMTQVTMFEAVSQTQLPLQPKKTSYNLFHIYSNTYLFCLELRGWAHEKPDQKYPHTFGHIIIFYVSEMFPNGPIHESSSKVIKGSNLVDIG